LPWNPWYGIFLLRNCLWELSITSMKCVLWDPGVKVSLYRCLNSLTIWSKTDKPLSCTRIPDLAAWSSQSVSSVVCIWDPGIRPSSSLYSWLQILIAATENLLSSFQTPELTTWLSLMNNASFAWDLGTTLLQYKSICLLWFTK
jgi:hypothetical protein